MSVIFFLILLVAIKVVAVLIPFKNLGRNPNDCYCTGTQDQCSEFYLENGLF